MSRIHVAVCRYGDELELGEALVAFDYIVYPLHYQVETFHPRKTIVTKKTEMMFPGYVLVRGSPSLRRIAPMIPARWLSDSEGNPVRLDYHSADRIKKLAFDCADGLHDVKLPPKGKVIVFPPPGTRVHVKMFDRVGTVVRQVGRCIEVVVDEIKATVKVSHNGFEVV